MLTPEFVKAMYENGFTGTFRLLLGVEAIENHTFASTAIDTSTNAITVTNTYAAGCRVTLATDGTLSTDLELGTVYFVVSPTGSAIQLSRTFGGSAIDFTDQGTGTYTITEVSHSSTVTPSRSVADLARIEITDYEGIAARPSVTNPTVILGDDPDPVSDLKDVTQVPITFILDNSSGTLPVDFDTVIVIKGGTDAPGNTTGSLIYVGDMGVLSSVDAAQNRQLTITLGGF
jgi:hypothetical protein